MDDLKNTCTAKLQLDQDDEIYITGYKKTICRTLIYYLFCIVTLGGLRLILFWWSHWYLMVTHSKCYLVDAEKVLVTEYYKKNRKSYYNKEVFKLDEATVKINKTTVNSENFEIAIHFENGIFEKTDNVRYFVFKKLKFVWKSEKKNFIKLRGLDKDIPGTTLLDQKGLSEKEQYSRRIIYGLNTIRTPMKGVIALLLLEVSNAFYLFQLFSIILWLLNDYIYYAIVIAVISIWGVIVSVIQSRANEKELNNKVQNSEPVSILRENDAEVTVDSKLLVPGDVLNIPFQEFIMQCDAVLLSGNCIVDESMLTGECVPVTKTPLPRRTDLIFDVKTHARHTLFCGTKVIQTRYVGSEKVLAVVINTGNTTVKGDLIRSISYPPPVDYKFEKDSYKFVFLLSCVAAIGVLYTLIYKWSRGLPLRKIIFDALDLITIAVPPALYGAITVGHMRATKRLEFENIFCTNPRSINVASNIDCVCFDKTGTLTEAGLDMWGVIPNSKTNHFEMPSCQIHTLPNDHLLYGLVTCHSLKLINDELKGDLMELKMFESTKWILEEANDKKFDYITVRPPKPTEICTISGDIASLEGIDIVKEFSFTSSLQRMSVITRKLYDKHFSVYCKGSPEMIKTICKPTTIPVNFKEKLDFYAQQGYRIIAIAHKLDTEINDQNIQSIVREQIECDLEFLGFLIFENRLKSNTTSVINILKEANMRIIMVTGDNILTAMSVGIDCGIITKEQKMIIVNMENNNGHKIYYNLYKNEEPILTNESNGKSTSINNLMKIDDVKEDIEGQSDEIVQMLENVGNDYRFAMTGETWYLINEHFFGLIPKFITRGIIFARMSPQQKQQLIIGLQEIGYCVAMCGDGANDYGALSAAHIGISISGDKHSIAAPFTSRNTTIACIPSVIKEGRAALATILSIIKYMAAYSLIQFASVIILYSIDSNFSDLELLYIDLFMIVMFLFFFGKKGRFKEPLSKIAPINSLMSLSVILSLALHLISAVAIQIAGWYHVQAQDWFQPFIVNDTGNKFGCHQNYTIFVISCLQYILLGFVFSNRAPYRNANSYFGFLISLGITLWLTIAPGQKIAGFVELVLPPSMTFKLYLVGYGVFNLLVALIIEIFIIEYLVVKKLRYKFRDIQKSKKKFLKIEFDMRHDLNWPPINNSSSLSVVSFDERSV